MSSVLDRHYDDLLDTEFPFEKLEEKGMEFSALHEFTRLLGKFDALKHVVPETADRSIEDNMEHSETSAISVRTIIEMLRKRAEYTISLRTINFHQLASKYDSSVLCGLIGSAAEIVAELFIANLDEDGEERAAIEAERKEVGEIDSIQDHVAFYLQGRLEAKS